MIISLDIHKNFRSRFHGVLHNFLNVLLNMDKRTIFSKFFRECDWRMRSTQKSKRCQEIKYTRRTIEFFYQIQCKSV